MTVEDSFILKKSKREIPLLGTFTELLANGIIFIFHVRWSQIVPYFHKDVTFLSDLHEDREHVGYFNGFYINKLLFSIYQKCTYHNYHGFRFLKFYIYIYIYIFRFLKVF